MNPNPNPRPDRQSNKVQEIIQPFIETILLKIITDMRSKKITCSVKSSKGESLDNMRMHSKGSVCVCEVGVCVSDAVVI